MLQELSMVEQRYLAVREVLDTGAVVGEVASGGHRPRRMLPVSSANSGSTRLS